MNPFKSHRVPPIPRILMIIGVCFVAATFLPSTVSANSLYPAWKTQTKNEVTLIATALNTYLLEYGKLPRLPTVNANSARLMDILGGVVLNDPDNPKGIVFLDVPKAKDHRNGAEVDGRSGLFSSGYKDTWGNDYEIRIDPDLATHPHEPTVEGPEGTVPKAVIGWSRGDPAKTRDYENKDKWIKSWE